MNLDIRCGSSLHMDLPDASIQCVVTSPPYWGLRKYDGEQELVWGGDVECEHEWGCERTKKQTPQRDHASDGSFGDTRGQEQSRRGMSYTASQGSFCLKCGAWRGAYGLEPTPELYVEHTVMFLREIRRVLKDDGVCWWNVADSYWGSAQGHGTKNPTPKQASNTGTLDTITSQRRPLATGSHAVLKPKDMCLIPERVKIAAQADGWWVRSDIIWAKPNPMPESVRDRPTSSYEHIFLFTKSKDYYWDIDAVREPHSRDWAGENMGSLSARADYTLDAVIPTAHVRQDKPAQMHPAGRNLRDVWTIATQPSGFRHYAAFPEEIPTRCIKAATRPGDTVLDPFCGTGRTLEAALKLGRNAVGYDLSEAYCEMARQRCSETQVEMIGGRY